MAGSVAGLVGGSCPACKGSGKAQPGRPVEDPVGGGVPNEPDFHGAIDATHLPSTNKGAKPTKLGQTDTKRGADKAPVKDNSSPRAGGPEGGTPSAAGEGSDTSKRGAETAQYGASPDESYSHKDDVWQPKSTWEHGWGSEAEPNNHLEGDETKPGDLEEEEGDA
jgi:hypothetical protein